MSFDRERWAVVSPYLDDVLALDEQIAYRSSKFVRRRRSAATAATLVTAALSLALYVANRGRALAKARFTQVRQLANRLFDIDLQVRTLPGGSSVRPLIVDTSASKPQTDTNLLQANDLSNLYQRLAERHRKAGQPALASEVEARRLELWRHWERRLPNSPFVRRQRAAATPQ